MAKPIKVTPVLRGDNLFAFILAIEKPEKISAEKKRKIKENAAKLQLLPSK